MTLELYILRRISVAIAASLGVFLVVLIPPIALSAITRLGGVGLGTFLGYLPYLLVELFPYLIPLAFLIGTTATFDRLFADGEWIAIVMGGIHPLRILAMPLMLAGLLFGINLWLLRDVFPDLRLGQRIYEWEVAVKVVRDLFPGRSNIQLGGFAIVAKSRRGNTFQDVLVTIPRREESPPRRIMADSLRIAVSETSVECTMVNARSFFGRWDSETAGLCITIPLDHLITLPEPNRKRAKFSRSTELMRRAKVAKPGSREKLRLLMEVHRRNALAAVFFVFFLLGPATGALLGRGNLFLVMLCSASIAFAYYALSVRLGEELSESGVLPVWCAAWGTNFLAMIGGVITTYRGLLR